MSLARDGIRLVLIASTVAACAGADTSSPFVHPSQSSACVSCHQRTYDSTAAPVHLTASYPTSCADCHTIASWLGATFDHNTKPFPLTGAHAAAACAACHADGVYKDKPTTCLSCHQVEYDATTDPPHSAAAFAPTCQDCHSTVNFTSATWTHPTNLFQFTGAHVGLVCAACHGDGVYKGKGTTCVTCHLHNYNATTTPVHSTAGYGTDCVICHTPTTWLGAVFNHVLTWPDYTGAHPAVACTGCHSDNVYKGKSTLCASCHTTDYNNTTDPKHSSAGFATTCKDCHSTVNFTTSSWVHPTHLFQFTGAHVGLDCAACHVDDIFQGKGTTCVTCHLVTYDTTSTPVHSTAGYSTDCVACHTTTTWLGATGP